MLYWGFSRELHAHTTRASALGLRMTCNLLEYSGMHGDFIVLSISYRSYFGSSTHSVVLKISLGEIRREDKKHFQLISPRGLSKSCKINVLRAKGRQLQSSHSKLKRYLFNSHFKKHFISECRKILKHTCTNSTGSKLRRTKNELCIIFLSYPYLVSLKKWIMN
jgi:hypothetical protein